MSKVTSIWGTQGAGEESTRGIKLAEEVVVHHVPTPTLVHLNRDTGWLSSYVEKISDFFVGTVGLLRSIAGRNGILDSGTIGNGLIGVDALVGLLAIEDTSFTIQGIKVEPPTTMISWMSPLSILESRRTFSMGSRVLSSHSSSKQA
jgi:hypothetical protein